MAAAVLLAPQSAIAQAWHVVVFDDGSAKPEQKEIARKALADGIGSVSEALAGAAEQSDAAKLIAGIAVGGRCDADCERTVRKALAPARVVVGHLSVNGTSFVLQGASDARSYSAIGPLDRLADGAQQLGRRLTAKDATLVLDPGGKWFLDGKPVTPGPNGRTSVAPGSYVLRYGDGRAEGALQRLDLAPGAVVAPVVAGVVIPAAPAATPTPVAIAKATPAVAAPTPTPVRTTWSGPAVIHVGRAKVESEVEAGLVFASWTRSISGGTGFATHFGGTGPRIVARATWLARYEGEIEAQWVSYAPSTATVDVPGGGTASVTGGSTLGARLTGGYDVLAYPTALRLFAGAGYESHRAQDLHASSGDLSVFPSHTRAGVEAGVAVRAYDLLPWLRLGALASVTPWSTWSETPSGASGSSPASRLGWRWAIDAGYRMPTGPLSVELTLGEEMQAAQFSGNARAAASPTITDARVRHRTDELAVSVRYAF